MYLNAAYVCVWLDTLDHGSLEFNYFFKGLETAQILPKALKSLEKEPF